MKRRKQQPKECRPSGPSAEIGDGVATPTSQSGLLLAGSPDLTKRELVLLAIVVAAGMGLRIAALSRSAVEHFDEGVYASNIYFGAPGYAYPLQQFYAPPLLPALIEAGMMVGLPPNVAALLPSFLAGCATIALLWWFGRSWFGPEVGLSAAALAALSDFHVALSAAALTDVLLGLWLVLAVDAIRRSLVNGDLRWGVGAGLYTGLAWWTKYNGWLPLAIEAAALPVLWLLLRPPPKRLLSWLGCFGVTAIVAVAVWSPYYLSLQSSGGYGPIAANHAKYVVGFSGWLDAAARQITNLYVVESPVSALGAALAVALPAFLSRRNAWETMWRVGVGVLAGALAFFWSSLVVIGFAAAIGLGRSIIALRETKQSDGVWQRRAIGLAIVTTWWVGLLVATPCYTPYPRLVLPWLLAACVGMGLNCADFGSGSESVPASPSQRRWIAMGAAVFAIGLLFVVWLYTPHFQRFAPLGDRRGLLQVAEQIHQSGADQQPRAIFVYGEPALFFQLRSAGEEIVVAIQDVPSAAAKVDERPIGTLLAVGPHARRDPRFQEQWAAAKERWELVETHDYRPSALVWLDLHDPRQSPKETDDAVQLYRMWQ
jgi:dolichyl-phosphate-mannose-protein mannosyltransferase